MAVQKNLELHLQQIVLPELEAGRPNWDVPHTQAVVDHIKLIVANTPELTLDESVLVIAAYAHDWGYAGLFKDGKPLELSDVKDKKSEHMKISAEKLKELLESDFFQFLSEEQKKRAVHLVANHDLIYMLKDPDELVLMEADTLGGLDITKITPAFNKESNEKYMKGVLKDRFPKFITSYGKKEFERLYKLREDYYKNK